MLSLPVDESAVRPDQRPDPGIKETSSFISDSFTSVLALVVPSSELDRNYCVAYIYVMYA